MVMLSGSTNPNAGESSIAKGKIEENIFLVVLGCPLSVECDACSQNQRHLYILYSFPGPPLSDMARLAQDVTGIPQYSRALHTGALT